jgi:hypothetical protein
MARKLQSCLTNFLYDARVDGEGSQGAASESLFLPMEHKAISVEDVCGTQAAVGSDSAASCEAPPPTPTGSSALDCILLNKSSTPAAERVEFPPVADLSKHAAIPDV